jgi:hypothetical protein
LTRGEVLIDGSRVPNGRGALPGTERIAILTFPQGHYDLLDAMQEKGCPVCHIALRGVQHYLESINYEYVNDPAFREEVEPAQGFCSYHATQWLHTAHVLGTALIYRAVLRSLTRDLERMQPRRRQGGILAGIASAVGPAPQRSDATPEPNCDLLLPRIRCPACARRAEIESTTIETLIEGLEDPEFRTAYERSDQLCIPHLRQALCRAPEEPGFSVLRDAAVATHRQLEQHLSEVIRKHDYRFKDEPRGEERDSVARAVNRIAGLPGIDHR